MRRALGRLLDWTPVLLALPLYAVALAWGWGPEHLWAWDELRPAEIVAPPYAGAGSWPAHYPLLHRDLLRLLFAVVEPFAALFGVREAVEFEKLRFVAGRALTLLLALATVRLAFLVARRITLPGTCRVEGGEADAGDGRRAGALAAFAWLAVLPQTYYAKTTNLDAPYLFWTALAVWAFVRVRAEPRLRFSLLFFGAAAAAVLTKDQAYGLFVLPALLLLVETVRRRPRSAGAGSALRLLGWPVLGAALFAAASYRLVSGGGGGSGGMLRRHLEALLAVPATFAFTAPDLASHSARFLLALRHVLWSFGGPLAVVVAAGVAVALLSRRGPGEADGARPSGEPAALLLFPLSYLLFSLLPLGYNYDRFLLPVCWVLAVVAGAGLAGCHRQLSLRGARLLVTAAFAVAVVWGLGRCVALDCAMAGDRRYALEAATRGTTRASFARFVMRAPQGFDMPAIPPRGEPSLAVLSRYEVVAIPLRDLGDFRLAQLFQALSSGACGFRRERLELDRQSELRQWIDFTGVLSNLAEVDPPLALFRRAPPVGPCPEPGLPAPAQ